jgi:stage V sporulation protein D (sporulation-specific penicillin-binding protein)
MPKQSARPAGYRIGGKTGTAETLPRFNGEYIVSFIGYAPAEDPQIAVYVVVDRPNTDEQDDPLFATELVRSIFAEVLPYKGIYMSEPVTDEEREELEELGLSVTYTGDEPSDKWEFDEYDW